MFMFLLNACKWVRLATGSKLKQFLWQNADYEVRKGDTAVTTHVLETPLPPLSRDQVWPHSSLLYESHMNYSHGC